jgi:hypothetical protein
MGTTRQAVSRILLILTICLVSLSCNKVVNTQLYAIGEPPKSGQHPESEMMVSDFNGWAIHVKLSGAEGEPSHKDTAKNLFGLQLECRPSSVSETHSKIAIDSVMLELSWSGVSVPLSILSHNSAQGSEITTYKPVVIDSTERSVILVVFVRTTSPSGSTEIRRIAVTMRRYSWVKHGWVVD